MSASVTAFTSRATFVHPRCRSMSLGKEAVRKNNSVMGLRDKLPVQKLIRYSGYGRGEQRCALGVEMKHIRLIMPRGRGLGSVGNNVWDSIRSSMVTRLGKAISDGWTGGGRGNRFARCASDKARGGFKWAFAF